MMTRKIYETAGILGTGLIGGSLGMALRGGGSVAKVVGYDVDRRMLEEAVRRGAVDEAAADPSDLASSCDLVVLAVPVRSAPGVLSRIAHRLRPGTTVSDVGSVKSGIMRVAAEVVPSHCHFIGGHPLTGSEQRGVEFADPGIFQDAYYVLTPTEECDAEAYSRLHALLASLGARVVAMDPAVHDRAVSVISHLPHVMAMGLMNLALRRAEEYPLLRLVAGGFRDVTRIAASDPALWLDILVENSEAVKDSLRELIADLESIYGLMDTGDEKELLAWMERASSGRRNLAPALRESLAELYVLALPVADRPGVISDVTLTVGEMGINIDDLELVHTLESGQGILRLTITGEETSRRAAEALRYRGYRVSVRKALGED